MPDPAVAGICPNDGSAVTFHLDAKDPETGLGVFTGLPGDVYHGRCDTCHQVLTKVAGPVHTTVGGGPSPLEDLRVAVEAGRVPLSSASVPSELETEYAKLSPDDQVALLQSIKDRNERTAANAAEDAEVDEEERNAPPDPVDSKGFAFMLGGPSEDPRDHTEKGVFDRNDPARPSAQPNG